MHRLGNAAGQAARSARDLSLELPIAEHIKQQREQIYIPGQTFGGRPPYNPLQFRLVIPLSTPQLTTQPCYGVHRADHDAHEHLVKSPQQVFQHLEAGRFDLAFSTSPELLSLSMPIAGWLRQANPEQCRQFVQHIQGLGWVGHIYFAPALEEILQQDFTLFEKLVRPEFIDFFQQVLSVGFIAKQFARFEERKREEAGSSSGHREVLLSLLPSDAAVPLDYFFDLDNLTDGDIQQVLRHIEKFAQSVEVKNGQLFARIWHRLNTEKGMAGVQLGCQQKAALVFLLLTQTETHVNLDKRNKLLRLYGLCMPLTDVFVEHLANLIIFFPMALSQSGRSWKVPGCPVREMHPLFHSPETLAQQLTAWYQQLNQLPLTETETVKLQLGLDCLLNIILTMNDCQSDYQPRLIQALLADSALSGNARKAVLQQLLDSAFRTLNFPLCKLVRQKAPAVLKPSLSPLALHYMNYLCQRQGISTLSQQERALIAEKLPGLKVFKEKDMHFYDLEICPQLINARLRQLRQDAQCFCRPQQCFVCKSAPVIPEGTDCMMFLPCTHYLCTDCYTRGRRSNVSFDTCSSCRSVVKRKIRVVVPSEAEARSLLRERFPELMQKQADNPDDIGEPSAKRDAPALQWPGYPHVQEESDNYQWQLSDDMTEWLYSDGPSG